MPTRCAPDRQGALDQSPSPERRSRWTLFTLIGSGPPKDEDVTTRRTTASATWCSVSTRPPPGRGDPAGPGRVSRPSKSFSAPRAGDDYGTERAWTFVTEVRQVADGDGAWLRQQLASVVQELAMWAHRGQGSDSSDPDDKARIS